MREIGYDVAIVGSGAAGSVVADVLSSLGPRGARIALIESGPYYGRESFHMRELEMSKMFWDRGGWPTEDGSITVATGRCVGGSTAMYTGVSFRPPDEVIRGWNLPGLGPEDLGRRLDRIEPDLNVHEMPDPEVNAHNRLFRQGVEKLGWHCQPLRINVRNCQGYGFCNLGCPSGAKQGALEVQIPRAVRAGVDLIHNCHVESVGPDRTLIARIDPAASGTRPNLQPEGEVRIRAGAIVLCAGAIGTPALLLRSRLAGQSPVLGRYLTLHPALTVQGIHEGVVDGHRGFPKTYYCPDFSASHGYFLETAFYYPFVTSKNVPGWGVEHRRLMREYRRFMMILILNHDEPLPENRVLVREGRTRIDYRLSQASIESLTHAQRSAARIFFAAGCKRALMPGSSKTILERADEARLDALITPRAFRTVKTSVASAHPQGGCRMESDPRESVTDSWGQVHGHPWLWVADASLFPTSVKVNPYLTVMALAERTAERVRDRVAAGACAVPGPDGAGLTISDGAQPDGRKA